MVISEWYIEEIIFIILKIFSSISQIIYFEQITFRIREWGEGQGEQIVKEFWFFHQQALFLLWINSSLLFISWVKQAELVIYSSGSNKCKLVNPISIQMKNSNCRIRQIWIWNPPLIFIGYMALSKLFNISKHQWGKKKCGEVTTDVRIKWDNAPKVHCTGSGILYTLRYQSL